MQPEQDVATRILQVLKFRPKGMTITEIAKKIRMNRNAVSKYLEVLQTAGQVNVRVIGNAKVYSIAQRVPLSAFLCFTSNLILILDSTLTVVQANEQFISLAGRPKAELVGLNLEELTLPVVSSPEVMAAIRAKNGNQSVTEVRCDLDGVESWYRMQLIPTVFEDGDTGTTLVMEDITERKHYERDMELLAKTAMEFVELPFEGDIYQIIVERICDLVPGARAYLMSIDETDQSFCIQAVSDAASREQIREILGRDIIGMRISLDSIRNELKGLLQGGIKIYYRTPPPGVKGHSLHDFCFGDVNEDICATIINRLNIGSISLAALSWDGQPFGSIVILLPLGAVPGNEQAVESFTRLASIAIRRRISEDNLRKSEWQFRHVIDLSPFPVAIIDRNGRYIYINKKFTDIFGYTREDIPDGREWFERAFPDPYYRDEAIAVWKKDKNTARIGEARPRTFRVRCKDGTDKVIVFRPITLCDQNQYLTYEDITDTRLAHMALLTDIAKTRQLEESLKLREFALDVCATPLAITDPEGHLNYTTSAFRSIWRCTDPVLFIGRHISYLWEGEDAASKVEAILSGNERWEGELNARRCDATTFAAQVSAEPVTGTNGTVSGRIFTVLGH